jgi:nucleotide-binding universal stress UspA family protein
MWQRILAATGGSPWSNAAVAYAIELAARTKAELCLLTVLQAQPQHGSCDEIFVLDQLTNHIENEGKERLTGAAIQAAHAGVVASTVIKWGHIPTVIVDSAREEECDLIVMGTRTLTGWKRLRVGNIANAVTAKATQPVLFVKQAPPIAAEKPLWRRLLVATGGSAWSNAAVAYALAWAQQHQLELCGLHVTHQSLRRGVDDSAAGDQVLAEVAAQATALGVAFEAVRANGNIPAAILATASDKQCDALVLGSRGLAGWKRLMVGGIANAVAAKASLPVLIVKHFEAHTPLHTPAL